jgi:hypothetical protein
MKKALVVIILVLFGLALISAGARAEEKALNTGTFSGKAYFNYNHDFSQDRGPGSGQTNGFHFTRIYFGYDKDLDETFSIRFLMDAENSNGAWRPFMKNAYLSMKCKLVEGSRWYFGMVPTALTNVPEAGWGYRSVFKMPMDQFSSFFPGQVRSLGSTADLGLYWKGTIQDMLQVEFNLINGAGYKAVENDMFKKFDIRPTLYLLDKKALTLSAYASYEAANDSSNAMVISGYGGYEMSLFRVGVEYSMQSLSNSYMKAGSTTWDAQNSSALAAWAVVKATEKISVLGRYDIYDPNTDVDKDGSAAIVAGLDFHPIKNVRFIPNVQIMTVQADDNPNTPIKEDASLNTALVTFEYSW